MAREIILNNETGLDEDFNNVFMCKSGYYTQYRLGKISEKEFLEKISESIPTYEKFLEERLKPSEVSYCIFTANPKKLSLW